MKRDSTAILPMSKAKLYRYIRWSSEKQSRGTSFARQKNVTLEYVDSHVFEMVDSGFSAFKGENLGVDSTLGRFIKATEAGGRF